METRCGEEGIIEASTTIILWFRRDLRLNDHPALWEAAERAETVVPIFVDPSDADDWNPGPAKRWWCVRTVDELRDRLRDRGLDLVIRNGSAADELRAVAAEVDADALFFNKNHVPVGLDGEVSRELRDAGVRVETFRSRLLHDPSAIRTTSGGPYHVFTPFWRKFREEVDVDEPRGMPEISESQAPEEWPDSRPVESLGVDEETYDGSPDNFWTPGERRGRELLSRFVEEQLDAYETGRDRPDLEGTSRLSPYLHFGELSPRTVWRRTAASSAANEHPDAAESFLSEIAWREFSYHLLVHYPETVEEPLREKFEGFPWHSNPEALERWQRGRTGYPLVDAGMRQLRQSGWMHNRVRMVTASFLTKHLLIPWQRGAEWFWSRLVDADLANNTMGWQWAAGCGADAQPFFRIFNPISQSERHDPEGAYIRRWVPELQNLPDGDIHTPWRCSDSALEDAGLELGRDYPEPIVDHDAARARALEAWEQIK